VLPLNRAIIRQHHLYVVGRPPAPSPPPFCPVGDMQFGKMFETWLRTV
jgi:hypothetical protein